MDKLSLIKILSKRYNTDEINMAEFVDNVFDVMRKIFLKNKNIHFPGFGRFAVRYRERNGVTSKYITFSPSVKFSDEVNKNYNNLKPLIISAFNLKESDNYYITEVPDGYLIKEVTFFGFDDEEIIVEDNTAEDNTAEDNTAEDNTAEDTTVEDNTENTELKIDNEIKDVENDKKIITSLTETEKFTEKEVTSENLVDEPTIIDNEADLHIDNSDTAQNEEEKDDVERELSKLKSQNIFISDVFYENTPDEIKKDSAYAKVNKELSDKNNIPQGNVFVNNDGREIKEPELLSPLSQDSLIESQVDERTGLNFELKEANIIDENEIRKIDDEIVSLLYMVRNLINDINKEDTKSGEENPPSSEQVVIQDSVIEETFPPQEEINETSDTDVLSKADYDIIDEFEDRFKEISNIKNFDSTTTTIEQPQYDKPVIEEFKPEVSESLSEPLSESLNESIAEQDINSIHLDNQNIFEELPVEIDEFKETETNKDELKSLDDAFESVELEGVIEKLAHLDMDDEDDKIKSYDDVFKRIETGNSLQNNQDNGTSGKWNKIMKFFIYFFFILIMGALFFFVYKSVLTRKSQIAVIDTLGLNTIDSIKSIIPIETLKTENIDESIEEDFVIEHTGDTYFRQTSDGYKIQIAAYDNLLTAEKFVSTLQEKNIDAKVERVDLPANKYEYRIILGPFKTLQEAKSFYSNSYVLFNYIKVLIPAKSNFLTL